MVKTSNNFKYFLSDGSIYTFVNLVNKAIPFLLLPIIVRMVDTKEYGIYSLFITFETLIIPIVSFNIHSALSSHFFDDSLNLNRYLSSTIIFLFAVISFLCFVALCLPHIVVNIIGIQRSLIFIAVLTAGIHGLFNYVSTLFRLQRKPWVYGGFTITNSLFLLLSVIFFVVWFKPSSEFLVFGRFVSFVIFGLLTIFALLYFNYISLVFDVRIIKRVIRFSIPTIVFSISAFVFISSDRFLIKHFIGIEAVGHYSAIYQVASLISVLGMSLNAAWIPWLFENLKKKDAKTDKFIVKISYILMAAFLMIGLLFCLLFPIISKIILTKGYYSHISVGIPLIIGFVFQTFYFIVSPYISYTETTKYLAFGGIGVAVINIVLNLFLIPKFGILGAGYSNCICWMCLFIYSYYCSSKVYLMPWHVLK